MLVTLPFQIASSRRVDSPDSTSSIFHNTLGLSMRPLDDDTMTSSLSTHPISYHNVTDAAADRDIGGSEPIGFSGRISDVGRPSSPAGQMANIPARRTLRQFPSGR